MNKLPRVRQLASLLAGLLAPTAELVGQTISGRAVIAAPRVSVRLGDITERVDGLWAGGAVGFQAGRFVVTASGTRGQLTASETGTVPKRDVGEFSASGQYEVLPWLSLDLGYAIRAFSSAAGYQRWEIARIGATVSRDLGTRTVRAFAGVAYLPVLKVSGQERPTFALGSDVGIALLPTHLPIALQLDYRIERFKFPAASARSEQFEAFTLSMGVRMHRGGGRWRFGAPGK